MHGPKRLGIWRNDKNYAKMKNPLEQLTAQRCSFETYCTREPSSG